MVRGFVYFIIEEDTGRVKIGKTTNTPEDRLRSLRTGNSHPLKLICYMETMYPEILERKLHNRFSPYRIHGEWFLPHPDLVGFVLCHTLGIWKYPLPRTWSESLYADYKKFCEENNALR